SPPDNFAFTPLRVLPLFGVLSRLSGCESGSFRKDSDVNFKRHVSFAARLPGYLLLLVAGVCVLSPRVTGAQGLTGTVIVNVKDEQAAALAGARATLSSPALIGGAARLTANEKGQIRFPALPPGPYVLEIAFDGFTTYHEADIGVGAGAT